MLPLSNLTPTQAALARESAPDHRGIRDRQHRLTPAQSLAADLDEERENLASFRRRARIVSAEIRRLQDALGAMDLTDRRYAFTRQHLETQRRTWWTFVAYVRKAKREVARLEREIATAAGIGCAA